jgi:hypothetical protein
MSTLTEVLRARLRKLGMPFEGEQLARAEELVRSSSAKPQALDDITLMTVAGEAYRSPDVKLREVV